MKFSEQWLREWVNPPVSRQELVDQLTMAGLEVGAVEPVAPPLDGVVVGRVLSVAPHPNADRLRVCSVDVGADAPVDIVCGAPNVVQGMHAPTALLGATLAGDMRIKRAKLRGVESTGMLCSSTELGLSEEAEGLMELAADTTPGTPVTELLGLDDAIIELELTPNRGDCLSIAGVAREVGTLNSMDTTPPPIEPVAAAGDARFDVDIQAPADCPRYLGRVLGDIDPAARTPLWMQERLRRSGLRSLGPLVDVTNYVLLELGQPMHAFDLGRLAGAIQVRRARAGERLTLLDEKEIELDPDTLVIADKDKVLAMAGIMGGMDSGVSDRTRHLFLESAFFSPAAIVGRARRYGLQTDSSYRFERGVDPNLQARALERATRLLMDIVGGEPGPVIEVKSEPHLPVPSPITLRYQRIRRLLGFDLPRPRIAEVLQRLGMDVTEGDEDLSVTAPSFRFDIANETDLVEELVRIYGYDQVPTTLPSSAAGMTARPEREVALPRLRQALMDNAYQEVVTYSFVDPEQQQAVEPGTPAVALANPLASDQSVMRTSLWTALLKTMRYNRNRQQGRIRLFETGLVFLPGADGLQQIPRIGGAVSGSALPEQWAEPARAVDFYDLKGDVERLLSLSGPVSETTFEAAEHPALHPGQCARILRGDRPMGWIGALHPRLEKHFDLSGVYLFELDLEPLRDGRVPAFTPLSRFPAIRRDIALLVDRGVAAGDILETIRSTVGKTLQEACLFDVYTGKGVDPSQKSLALGLTLQDTSRTLKDQEVDAIVQRLVDRLHSDFAATLRD